MNLRLNYDGKMSLVIMMDIMRRNFWGVGMWWFILLMVVLILIVSVLRMIIRRRVYDYYLYRLLGGGLIFILFGGGGGVPRLVFALALKLKILSLSPSLREMRRDENIEWTGGREIEILNLHFMYTVTCLEEFSR